jgi:hypothetical protein
VSGRGQTIGLSVIDLDPSLSELEDLSGLHCHSAIADTVEEITIRDDAEAFIPRLVGGGEMSGDIVCRTEK